MARIKDRVGLQDAESLSGMVTRLEDILDGVGAWMASADRRQAAHMVREEFFELTGRVNEEDRSFEIRMNAFLEYLLVDSHLPGEGGRTWLEEYLTQEGAGLSEGDRYLVRCAGAGHRSLFQLISRSGKDLLLSDLLYGGQWRVSLPATLLGVDVGDVFEARLVSIMGHVVLLHSVLHHPSEAAPLVRRIVEKGLEQGQSPEKIAGRLASMLLRHDRYPGMNLLQAYGL